MTKIHTYRLGVTWTGNLGTGTSDYRSYSRDHLVECAGQPDLLGTADPVFRGARDRWNPEQLLVAAVAQCHLLWYLHLAAQAKIVVNDYADEPVGTMVENSDGSGQLTEVVLHPRVTVASLDDVAEATRLHDDVGALCFIARSVTFPIRHLPQTTHM